MDFLQVDSKPEKRSEAGLHAAFKSVFPIISYSGQRVPWNMSAIALASPCLM